MISVSSGMTFFINIRRGRHLCIVATVPVNESKDFIVVNITTYRNGCDQTVILHEGDHGFIKHDSVISYSDARILSEYDINDWIKSGFATLHGEPVRKDILKTICDGILRSRHTPIEVKKFYHYHFGK